MRNATVNSGLTAKQIESLVPKIDTASGKLAAGKTADAIQKLVDLQSANFMTKPRPSRRGFVGVTAAIE